MSSTPKTDSQLLTVKDCSYVAPHPDGEYVTAEFARELEHENAHLREDKDLLDWLDRHPEHTGWLTVRHPSLRSAIRANLAREAKP